VGARRPARSPEVLGLAAQAEAALREGAPERAAQAYHALVEIAPGEIAAWHALATIALRAGQPARALEPIARAIALDRKSAQLHALHAVALAELGRHAEAEVAARRAVKLAPADAGAHYNLGKILLILGRIDEAIGECQRSIALDPGGAGVYFNLALALERRGDFDAARSAIERGLKVSADDPWLLSAKAIAIERREGPSAAVAFYRAQLERLPGLDSLHLSLYGRLLGLGQWREAWPELLWRSQRRLGQRPAADEYRSRRLPARLDGERVLLLADWGLGDFLFFARFAPQLAARGARITLRAPLKLLALARQWTWAQVIPDEGPLDASAFDRVEALEDLPALLAVDAPADTLALRADEAQRARWGKVLARAGAPPYIGVTWRAGTDPRESAALGDDVTRLSKQCPIDALAGALAPIGGTRVVLQRAPRTGEMAAFAARAGGPLCDLSEVNEDLPAMAAVLSLLDDYVGVSNTNMHLRSALGRTARVLVPFPPEGRWGSSGDVSPWFPGFSIYRDAGDWGAALERLCADLAQAHGLEGSR
jgi:Flp pilus assembly protein TadD